VNDALSDNALSELQRLAIDAVHSVSELILSGFRSPSLKRERKPDGSVVTPFDLEAERRIRAFLGKHQPQPWPVFGEEFGADTATARYRWVLDPIDGTLPYSRGLPTFGTLLGFEDLTTQRSVVGVIHLPAMHETYSAVRGCGAWCGKERLHVTPERPLAECLVSLPVERYPTVVARASGAVPQLRCFADCYAHAMVARGCLDALAEFRLARWDIAASEVLIEEAGGSVRIAPTPNVSGKYDLILGSPQAAAALSELVGF